MKQKIWSEISEKIEVNFYSEQAKHMWNGSNFAYKGKKIFKHPCADPPPPPLPLSGAKTGSNYLNEYNTPFLPTEIGEHKAKPYNIYVKQRFCADVKSPHKRKFWTYSGGPLVTVIRNSEAPALQRRYTTYCVQKRTGTWARICKRLRSPGFDSKKSFRQRM